MRDASVSAKGSQSPIQFLKKVSERLGVPVWIKREDLFRIHGIGGSKVRKLSRILASARAKGATDLLTMGTTGSHHVHAASVLGESEGLDVHAVLIPQPDLAYSTAVFEKTKSTGSNLVYAPNIPRMIFAACRLFRALKNQGRRPYLILPGGSNLEGMRAYFDAGLELAADLHTLERTVQFDFQVCVYGTGGMTAGLAAACKADMSLPALYAVQVYPGFWNGSLYIESLSRLCARSAGIKKRQGSHLRKRIIIDPSYMGEGYGTENPLCKEAVSLFTEDGIFLDPVYTARAGQALISITKRRPKPRGLLLWYTAPGVPKAGAER